MKKSIQKRRYSNVNRKNIIFVSVNHCRKSTTKSNDFSKMTATTTYSFRKTMCFCISWKMHQKMKRFFNVFVTIFKHVLGNVRFDPTKSFIKIMIFSIFFYFFEVFFHGPRAWISLLENDMVRWPWKNISEKSSKVFVSERLTVFSKVS